MINTREIVQYIMRPFEAPNMADGQRALLTDTERRILAGEREVDDNYRHTVQSRVRTRVRQQFPADVKILREHHPGLLDELREVVCDDE